MLFGRHWLKQSLKPKPKPNNTGIDFRRIGEAVEISSGAMPVHVSITQLSAVPATFGVARRFHLRI